VVESDGGPRDGGEASGATGRARDGGCSETTPTRENEGDGRRYRVLRRTSSSYARRPHAPGAFLACRLMVAPSTPRDPSPGGLGLVERRARPRGETLAQLAQPHVLHAARCRAFSWKIDRDFASVFLGRREAEESTSGSTELDHPRRPSASPSARVRDAGRASSHDPSHRNPRGNGSSRPPSRVRITAPGRETPE
jgi:hypothetical protein